MLPSIRRTHRLALIMLAAAVTPVAAASTGGGGRDPRPVDLDHGAAHRAATDAVDLMRAAPRNREAEAATGDVDAMRAVVQEIVDCLRAKGFHPGDPEVHGDSVLIGDWDPGWDSVAGRATHDCAFPAG